MYHSRLDFQVILAQGIYLVQGMAGITAPYPKFSRPHGGLLFCELPFSL